MDALDSMSTVEFTLSVEKEFAVKLPEAAVARILTLRDLTACVARLLAEKATQPLDPPSPRQ
jgi:acyl carrier protein